MRNVLLVLICAAGFAQAPAPSNPPKPDADSEKDIVIPVNVNVVIAPTTVRSRNGEFINGLQLGDFQLFDNNKLQRVTADVRDEPLSLVIAVQKSGNLNELFPKVQRIGSMLNDLVAGQDGEVAVVAFDHRVQVVQDFTNETQKVSEAMKNIKLGSNNHALIDAEVASIRMLRKRAPDRRKVLLIIAEKRDKASELRLREALTATEIANVTVFSIDISTVVSALTAKGTPPPPPSIPVTAQHMPAGTPLTPTAIDQNYYMGNYIPVFVDIFKAVKSVFVDDTLDVFTRFTGGKQYSFIGERSLEKAVQGISEELHSQYLLSYSPTTQNEGGFHEIRVVVNRPNMEIRTRPGYWVAARPE
jgi:VWFA-related protein